jgi:DNA-binding PucR family transcriptional regulator
VPASRAATERALDIVARRGDAAPVTHIDAIRAEVVLDELLELAGTRPSLRGGPLAALAEIDRDGSRLATLRAYLDAHGDAAAAARRLDVHVNTLRYRLRRVVELTGLDLTDPDERLVAELQLRLVERD